MRLGIAFHILVTSLALLLALPAAAQTVAPPLINQEGLMLDRFGFPVDTAGDTRDLTFRIYDAADGGNMLWEEGHSVQIHSGYYNVILGSSRDLTPGVLDRTSAYLGIQLDGEAEMRPRQRIVSMPYAVRASEAVNATGDLTPNSVTASGAISASSGNITNNFTITGLLEATGLNVRGDSNVGGNLVVDGIIRGNLADNTVETSDVQDRALTEPKYADGSVSSRALADNDVTSADIRDHDVHIIDIGNDVFDAFGNAAGAGGEGRAFTIDADLVDGLDSSQFVRRDISQNVEGSVYNYSGKIVASRGVDNAHGIEFTGRGGDTGRIRYRGDQNDSELIVGNYGGGSDAVVLETGGGPIRFRGGPGDFRDSFTVHNNLTVGGNNTVVGAVSVGGSGAIRGGFSVGRDSTLFGNVSMGSDANIAGDLDVGLDTSIGRDIWVGGAGDMGGPLVVRNQITAANGNIVANNGSVLAKNGGNVESQGGDVVAGRNVRSSGAMIPSVGTGNRGVVFPTPPFDGNDRAWMNYYSSGNGGQGYLQLGIGNDGDDQLLLTSSGGVLIRNSADRGYASPGADLDVGGSLRARGRSQFDNDVEVFGAVIAIEIEADTLIVDQQITVNDVLEAREVLVRDTLVVSNGGNAVLRADLITGNLGDNMVASKHIVDGSIQHRDLGSDAVHSGNILDGSIRGADFANNSITSEKIADGTIVSADLANNAILSNKIADGQVESRHIRDGTIASADIGNNEIRSEDIRDGQVKTNDLAGGAVTNDKLANGAVNSAKIADGSIGGVDIEDRSIQGVKLRVNTVTNTEIQDRTVRGAELADNAVDARALAANSVGSGHLQDGGIKTQDLANDAVTGGKIADRTIHGRDIAGGTIGSHEIADGSITGTDIANGSITVDDIQPETIDHRVIRNGGIRQEDLGFDVGGGVGGLLDRGNIIFPLDNQGAIWRHGANGEEDWFMRREGEDMVWREPEDGNKIHMRIRDDNGVWARYGFDAGTSGAGGFRLDGNHVIQNDRDFFGRRLFLTGTDYREGGVPEGSIGFRYHNTGTRPHIGTYPNRNTMMIYSGESGSDKLVLAGEQRIEAWGAFEVHRRSKDDWGNLGKHTPLLSVYGADETGKGWNPGHDPIVYTRYLDGYPGAHFNRDTEKILIGNQPEWNSDYHSYVDSDFDNGDRNHRSGPLWTWEWWGWSGSGSRWNGWSVGTSGDHSPGGSDRDGHNTRSRYQAAHTWAAGGWRGRRCRWWRCWWSWYNSNGWTYSYFRWEWDAWNYPANAIIARGQFWYRHRAYKWTSWGTQQRLEFRINMYGHYGSRIHWEWMWNWDNGTRDTGWRRYELTPDMMFGWRLREVRFEQGTWAASRWNWSASETRSELWIDTFDISLLVADLSELQVYADATFWGSLHVKQDLRVWGRKQFVQDHPDDPNKEIAYVSLEGGEAGTYWRGSAALKDGKAQIPLPEHFALVTAPKGVTATVTMRAPGSGVFVAAVSNRYLEVRSSDGKKTDADFDFIVMGVRRGFENHVPVRYRHDGSKVVQPAPPPNRRPANGAPGDMMPASGQEGGPPQGMAPPTGMNAAMR